MKKILCPTDFSDAAINGIAYAAKLAKKIGADLTLLHVVALTDLLPEEVLMGEQVNTASARARLEWQCREVTQVFKVSCYSDIESTPGSTSKVISQKASLYDLVVMGSNGIDALAQFLKGSKTYQVIRKSSVPVIMVPEHCVYSEIEHLVYAYDYWNSERFPLMQLISFSKIMGGEITVLQIVEEPLTEKAKMERAQWQRLIADLYKDEVNLRFECVVNPDIIEGINGYMKQSEGDIIALCSEHRNFLSSLFHKSVIKSVTGTAYYPVLVFHS